MEESGLKFIWTGQKVFVEHSNHGLKRISCDLKVLNTHNEANGIALLLLLQQLLIDAIQIMIPGLMKSKEKLVHIRNALLLANHIYEKLSKKKDIDNYNRLRNLPNSKHCDDTTEHLDIKVPYHKEFPGVREHLGYVVAHGTNHARPFVEVCETIL